MVFREQYVHNTFNSWISIQCIFWEENTLQDAQILGYLLILSAMRHLYQNGNAHTASFFGSLTKKWASWWSEKHSGTALCLWWLRSVAGTTLCLWRVRSVASTALSVAAQVCVSGGSGLWPALLCRWPRAPDTHLETPFSARTSALRSVMTFSDSHRPLRTSFKPGF